MARSSASSHITAHAAGQLARTGSRSLLSFLVVSLRPEQWTKNLLIFAGLVFGGRLLELDAALTAVATFAIFCALSGAAYLFNDVADRDADRSHPLKRTRAVASGTLPIPVALGTAVGLAAAAIAAASRIAPSIAAVATAYIGLLLVYSWFLKHVVILDVLSIAGGFVLRAMAGALAVAVPIGSWLLVCTTLLALFLALSKRRHELVVLGDEATEHRRILGEYTPYLLDQMIAVVTASTLIAYTVYATSAETAVRLGTPRLGLTIPFVLYGIFRYLYLVHQKREGGSPAAVLLTDRPLLACVGLWTATVVILMYSAIGV
jgi:4-hydroxybenzoate polyprenyltransferase